MQITKTKQGVTLKLSNSEEELLSTILNEYDDLVSDTTCFPNLRQFVADYFDAGSRAEFFAKRILPNK